MRHFAALAARVSRIDGALERGRRRHHGAQTRKLHEHGVEYDRALDKYILKGQIFFVHLPATTLTGFDFAPFEKALPSADSMTGLSPFASSTAKHTGSS